jgi:4-hydroxy-3-methylbut-2-en-1-yl diphosphate synthase IspG/GcpE
MSNPTFDECNRRDIADMAARKDVKELEAACYLLLDCLKIAEEKAALTECKECPRLRRDLMSATEQYRRLSEKVEMFQLYGRMPLP